MTVYLTQFPTSYDDVTVKADDDNDIIKMINSTKGSAYNRFFLDLQNSGVLTFPTSKSNDTYDLTGPVPPDIKEAWRDKLTQAPQESSYVYAPPLPDMDCSQTFYQLINKSNNVIFS